MDDDAKTIKTEDETDDDLFSSTEALRGDKFGGFMQSTYHSPETESSIAPITPAAEPSS